MADQKEPKEKNKGGYGRNGNLTPASMKTPEERAAMGRKGGRKAAETYAKRRSLNEIAKAMLMKDLSKQEARNILGDRADLLDDFSFGAILTMRQAMEAEQGSAKAYEILRDTAGFKPVEQIKTDLNVMTDQDRALLEKVAKRIDAGQEKP